MTKPTFRPAHEIVKQWEGGYSITLFDRGGETICGITRKAHPDWPGWKLVDTGQYSLLQINVLAEDLYQREYWRPLQCELFPVQRLATITYQAAVNCGVRTAAGWLQLTINLYKDPSLRNDGAIGNYTLAALDELAARGRIEEICEGFLIRQRAHYVGLVDRDSTQNKFIRGWLNRVREL